MLNAGEGIVVMDRFHTFHLDTVAFQMLVPGKPLGDVTHYILNKAGIGKSMLCDVFLVLELKNSENRT